MDDYNEERWTELVLAFKKQYGYLPTVGDLMMLAEAEASVALDKDSKAQTMREGIPSA